jgi:hypothetical protein
MDGSAAQSIYRLEKERAMQERRLSHTQLMAEAKEAFNKLLADAQLARKGGRPRTNPLPPGAANRPPVKPPTVTVAAATLAVKVVKPLATKSAAAPDKKAAVTKTPAHRTADRGLVKTSAKAKPALKASAKKPAKVAPRAAPKRAKPTPKQSIRGKKGR